MLQLVSKITEKVKAYGSASLREVGTLLTLCQGPYYAGMLCCLARVPSDGKANDSWRNCR